MNLRNDLGDFNADSADGDPDSPAESAAPAHSTQGSAALGTTDTNNPHNSMSCSDAWLHKAAHTLQNIFKNPLKKFKQRIRLLDASRKLKITRNVDYFILPAY